MIEPLSPAGPTVLHRLEAAWSRSDALFALLREDAWLERPIPLRHPFLFYLGHLPAFAWNLIGSSLLGEPAQDARLDRLFAFGIDPSSESEAAEERIDAWPELERVLAYRDGVRDALRDAYDRAGAVDGDPMGPEQRGFRMVLEHELMHHETLLYLLHELDPSLRRPSGLEPEASAAPPPSERVRVPAGSVELGVDWSDVPFAWDNELPARRRAVPAFELDRRPVSVDAFRVFVAEDGYRREDLWDPRSFAWLRDRGRRHPHGWVERSGRWTHRTFDGELPLDEVGAWPVVVTHAEAAAYACWRGARLPREMELARAAYGDASHADRPHPWGDADPAPRHGNFDLRSLDPVPVGSRPAGASVFGVEELVGNGWEWTSTDWAPHEGFETWHDAYAGYSADFFDGDHRVLFGGSWATDRTLLRRSFRNWFQPRYPYVFATFRCAWDG